MTQLRQTTKPFSLLRWFSGLSLVAIILTSSVSGYLLFLYLSNHLMERDARVTMEFVQSLSQINDPEPYFLGSTKDRDQIQLEEFFRHIRRMPDVLRANVYARDQTIIWSSDSKMTGKQFDDNEELQQALTGRLVFLHERRDTQSKVEHAYLPNEVTEFLESYVPIWDQGRSRVVGVVEIYKAPNALFEALWHGQMLVVIISALSGLILYLLLFWIVRRAARVMIQQQQALVAAENLSVIGELTSSVAHNLRNPLAAIRSSAELSLTDIEGPAREYLVDIVAEVDRLDQWVRELLVISHNDSDNGQTASLAQIVEAALTHFDQRLDKQGVRLCQELADNLPLLHANPDVLIQVLISLIANALDAMPDGGCLMLRSELAEKDRVMLQVIDSGTGIAEQHQPDLFKPLVSHKPGGLGIGLPLARRVVQRYGGTFSLFSEPGKGTTVSLHLPVT